MLVLLMEGSCKCVIEMCSGGIINIQMLMKVGEGV
jgi:hypothetical protein